MLLREVLRNPIAIAAALGCCLSPCTQGGPMEGPLLCAAAGSYMLPRLHGEQTCRVLLCEWEGCEENGPKSLSVVCLGQLYIYRVPKKAFV